MGFGTSKIYDILLKDFKVYDNTRIFNEDIKRFRTLLFSTQLFDDLNEYIDE